MGDPEFLQWLKKKPPDQQHGVDWVLSHTLHLSKVVQQENQRRRTFKKMKFQPTLADAEDQEMEWMAN